MSVCQQDSFKGVERNQGAWIRLSFLLLYCLRSKQFFHMRIMVALQAALLNCWLA
jgi:hypothetical protein